eukprot:7383721-Prymnesium_polylepis.3
MPVCRYVSEEFIGIQTIAHGEPDQREDKYILCHLYNQQLTAVERERDQDASTSVLAPQLPNTPKYCSKHRMDTLARRRCPGGFAWWFSSDLPYGAS